MVKRLGFVLVLLIFLAGCAAQPGTRAPDEKQDPLTGSLPASAVGSFDGLINKLNAGGATVESGGPVEQPFFSAPGQILKLNGKDVQVFEYPNEEARLAESSRISKDGGTIGTSMVSWIEPPHFWARGNMIVLYVGQDAQVIETLTAAMGPGITQP
jgi:hypothetical protein